MSTIDFANLLRQERQKARRNNKTKNQANNRQQDESKRNSTTTTTATATATTTTTTTGQGWTFDESLILSGIYQLRIPQDGNLSSSSYLACEGYPTSIYYISCCLHPIFQAELVDWLLTQIPDNPIPSCSDSVQSNGTWTRLKYAGRRVALFDARIRPFPEPLDTLAQQLCRLDTFQSSQQQQTQEKQKSLINHILVNDYTVNQVGIMPHTDGPAYFSCTATLSLESKALLQFTRPSSASSSFENTQQQQDQHSALPQPRQQLWLEPGSLVVFCQEAYTDWLHSIPPAGSNNNNNYDDDDDENECNVISLATTTTVASPRSVSNRKKRTTRRISLTFRIAL